MGKEEPQGTVAILQSMYCTAVRVSLQYGRYLSYCPAMYESPKAQYHHSCPDALAWSTWKAVFLGAFCTLFVVMYQHCLSVLFPCARCWCRRQASTQQTIAVQSCSLCVHRHNSTVFLSFFLLPGASAAPRQALEGPLRNSTVPYVCSGITVLFFCPSFCQVLVLPPGKHSTDNVEVDSRLRPFLRVAHDMWSLLFGVHHDDDDDCAGAHH